MRIRLVTFWLAAALVAPGGAAAEWAVARPGWRYEFPRDHLPHPEFKTEWWYFTGNLFDNGGRRFGYQLTFFRQGVRPPAEGGAETSRFVVDDIKIAHFALTDLAGGRFRFEQKVARGAFGEAGFHETSGAARLAWNDAWQVRMKEEGVFELHAGADGAELSLTVSTKKPWVIHGENGVSRKAQGEGHASHYYSGTRLATRGVLKIDGRDIAVDGESWLDREWATNQLGTGQVGWDWFSIQLDDGAELMLYRMRLGDGSADASSSGTFIAPDGTATHLESSAFQLKPLAYWTSKSTGGRYPIGWQLEIASLDLQLRIETPMREQELVLKPISYWEGMIDAAGVRQGRPIRGRGYMELTGYSEPLVGLSRSAE